jgi:hypothetical protein
MAVLMHREPDADTDSPSAGINAVRELTAENYCLI